jgi:PAS domain-containing protein
MNQHRDSPLRLLAEASSGRGQSSPGTWLFDTLRSAQDSRDVCYLLDEQRRFIYCNPAWDRFAQENGASQLTGESVIGTDLFAVVPAVLAGVYTRAFETVSATGRVWSQVYHCSSPEVFRRFRMRIHPVRRLNWFLVSNALVVERPHQHGVSAVDETYFSGGVVTMCAHCRLVRRVVAPDGWDFVPAYLRFTGRDTLKVSHGLCPICEAHFYPGF